MNAHRCLQHVSSDTRAWCGSRWLADSYVVVVVAVPCGAGTYYNIELDRCSLCHPGSYQHQQAQLQCQNCPPGTATVQYGATDIQQCEGSVWSVTYLLSDGFSFKLGTHYPCPRPVNTVHRRPVNTGVLYDTRVHGPWIQASFWTSHPCLRTVIFDIRGHGSRPWTRPVNTDSVHRTLGAPVFTSPPVEVRSIAMSVSVCLSVCMSACPCSRIRKPHVQTSRNFLYILPVVVARYSSNTNTLRYVHSEPQKTWQFIFDYNFG